MTHQHRAQLVGQHATLRAGRPVVVDKCLQRVMAEEHDRPGGARRELGLQPAQLGHVDRALPAAVMVDGVQHDAPDRTMIKGVVGGAVSEVAGRVAVSGWRARRPEVLPDVVGPGDRDTAGIGGHGQLAAAREFGQRVSVGAIEPGQQLGGVDVVRRGDELDGSDRKLAQPASRRDRALEHVVVIAMDGIPRQPEPGRPERVARRGQDAGCGREAVSRPRQIGSAAFGMPVTLVLHRRRRHAFIVVRVTGIGHDVGTVEQVDVAAQLVELAVVGGVTGHDGEVEWRGRDWSRGATAHRPHHRLGHVIGEELVRAIRADDADGGAQRRVRIREPVHQLGPARRLVVHDVGIRQVRESQQRRSRSLPAGRQASAAQLGSHRVLLSVSG